MRLDLKKDIETEKRKAFKQVIELANFAHEEIEYQTSYSVGHLLYSDENAAPALELHSNILKIRQETINKIKSAKNGTEIKSIVDSLSFV